MELKDKRVLVVGGSSGMGLATARAAAEMGAEVIIASRSAERVEAARAGLGGTVRGELVDASDDAAVTALFDRLGFVDHVVVSAAVVNRKSFFEVTPEEAHAAFETKFWSQFNVSRRAGPKVRPGGSITLFSGISSRRGLPSLVVASAINGAVEALCRSLALTLAPVRVNAVCPGFVDTPSHGGPGRSAVLEKVAASLPVKRVGRPEEIASAVLYLMQNGYATGSVVDVDGGHLAG